ncbi:angiopoietin-1 receptor-like, partial [Pocillopora damicornis]|uniref:angiopoietin-1 receptor-like n=1 Tax=Pocillopora damicornis TaxID=46731 RepID=UPI000F5548D1
NNSEKIFSGGRVSQNQIVKQFLAEVTRARIIRFQPVNYYIHKVLRVEVYGTKTPAASPVHPVIKNKEKEMFHNSSIKWNSPDANGCPVSMFSVYYKAIKSRNEESAWHRINTSSDANELSCSSLPLECGTDYEFKVSAWNDVGESTFSESWQVKSITGYPAIVNRTNQVNGSVVVVRWKPCTASLFTIYHREMLSEGKSHWKAVNVSRHETSYDLHLGCQKEHEIAVTAWNSSAETPLTSILKHGRLWRVRTFGDKPSPPIIKSKEVQMSGCDVNLKWGSTQDNGCPLTMYTVYYREVQSLGEDEYWHHINVTMDSTSTSLTSLKCNSEYTFKVTAWNELGESNTSKEWRIKTAQITDISRGRTLNIAVGCGLFILLTVGILCFMIRQRRKKRKIIRCHKTRRSMSDIVLLLLKEIPPERVTIMEQLGRGAFGKVHKAILREMPKVEVFFKPKEEREDHIKEGRVVAVKLLHERAGEEGKEQFVREISFMQRVGTHSNVLSMIGYWDRSEPIMLILEYVPHGDLLQWLRNKRQRVKCKNGIDGVVFESVDDLSDSSASSNGAASTGKSEDEGFHDSGEKLTTVQEFKEVSEKQDVRVTSEVLMTLVEQPFTDNKRNDTEVLGIKTPQTDFPSGLEGEKNSPSQQSNELSHVDVTLPTVSANTALLFVSANTGLEDFNADFRPSSGSGDDLNIKKAEDENGNEDKGREGVKSSIDEEGTIGISFESARSLPQPQENMERQQETSEAGEKAVDFTVQDVLCFAWQIARGMSSFPFFGSWSFGVLLWELCTMGGIPYPGIRNRELLRLLKSGYRMEKPAICSDELYELMLDCWRVDPEERPSFKQLITRIEEMMTRDTPYFDLNEDYESVASNTETTPETDQPHA